MSESSNFRTACEVVSSSDAAGGLGGQRDDTHRSDADLVQPSWEHTTQLHPQIPVPPVIPTLDCPSHVGRFPICRKIGGGGMAVVLEGYDAEFNRRLAVKLLQYHHKQRLDLARRFMEEAQIIGQLQHPNIPPVHHLGNTKDGRPFFTMKLIRGRTLAQLLKSRKNPAENLSQFISIFEKICKAIAYAHSRWIVHRDLKPSNIMVGEVTFGEVYVMDWGMAKLLNSNQVCDRETDSRQHPITLNGKEADDFTHGGRGTFGFMAVEQILGGAGQVDQRCDVFGLGAILYTILTGEIPYEVKTEKRLHELMSTRALGIDWRRLNNCGADPDIIALAKKCLANRKEDRPENAGALASTIAAYQAKVQREHRQKEIAEAERKVRKRANRKLLAAVSGMLVLASIALKSLHDYHRAALDHQTKNQQIAELKAQNQHRREFETAVEKFYTQANHDRFHLTATDLERARRLAAQQKDVPEMQRRLQEVEAHYVLLAQLERIRSLKSAVSLIGNGKGMLTGADNLYYSVFHQHDIIREGEDSKWVAVRVQKSPLCAHLLAALDDWSEVTKDPDRKRWLHDIVQYAAPHSSWHAVLRDRTLIADQKRSREFLKLSIPTQILLRVSQRNLHQGGNPIPALKNIVNGAPDNFWSHIVLGNAYFQRRRPSEAELEYSAAIALQKHSAVAHNNFGCALFYQGKLKLAYDNLSQALRLLSDDHPLYPQVAKHRRECDLYVKLDWRLERILKNAEDLPDDPSEVLQLADLCFRCKMMYLTAARFSARAFDDKPELAGNLRLPHRFQAGLAAVLAASGCGADADQIASDEEHRRWRRQALDWLTQELMAWEIQLNKAHKTGDHLIHTPLGHWLHEPALASVRDADALANLPADERKDWQQFWTKVKVLAGN